MKGESLETWGFRKALNVWPCYWGTGGKVVFLSKDWRRATVRLGLTVRTRNYVGTIFGGSIYGAIDPLYMLMLLKILGPGYIVWDKSANIRFRKPGRSLLEAKLELTEDEIETIRVLASREKSVDRVFKIDFKDAEGNVCATIDKTLYVKQK